MVETERTRFPSSSQRFQPTAILTSKLQFSKSLLGLDLPACSAFRADNACAASVMKWTGRASANMSVVTTKWATGPIVGCASVTLLAKDTMVACEAIPVVDARADTSLKRRPPLRPVCVSGNGGIARGRLINGVGMLKGNGSRDATEVTYDPNSGESNGVTIGGGEGVRGGTSAGSRREARGAGSGTGSGIGGGAARW